METAEQYEDVLRSMNSAQAGPEAKEYNLLRADEEYRNDNPDYSIYYQVKALFQSTDTRYLTESEAFENQPPSTQDILDEASTKEQLDYKTNTFWMNLINSLQREQVSAKKKVLKPKFENIDILEDLVEPSKGVQRLNDICERLPEEWTVLQLCKSFNDATTYSVFNDIIAADGAIYLALLRHCRSVELGPICVRFQNTELTELFTQYSTLIERFRNIININPKDVKTSDSKEKYWKDLQEFEVYLKEMIQKLRQIFVPYRFLFHGKRYDSTAVKNQTRRVFRYVDQLCQNEGWGKQQRVLLSMAALHANSFTESQLKAFLDEIANQNNVQTQTVRNMIKLCVKEWREIESEHPQSSRRFPIILVVDERLDHFHWERMRPVQEFTRVKSLHCLWRLYKFHKPHIKHGYYTVNVSKGMCVVNPEANLVNLSRRMRSFFDYWLPHWRHVFETVPTEQMMVKEAFNADCFVYAGHGTGLQYIPAKVICRTCIKSVVFLFGCDSTRLHSTGLYSALYGAHNFYHGALCPTVVGTLMPALDSNMDMVSVTILSRWLAPNTQQVIPWTQIDRNPWVTKGEIKAKNADAATLQSDSDYQQGSLCSLLSYVQQGQVEPNTYNCCIYVSRGLPAWNLAVQKLPF